MYFYETIEKRRTIRDFEPGDIPENVIERIISAAMKAPTNDHMRDWHYIVVKDREVAAKLLDIVPKGISDEDMDQLIRDWNLSDSVQNECYRNALPKQYSIPLGNEDEHARKVLGFPEDYFMPCFIGIGIPRENAPVPRQKSIDIKTRIHWDKY